MSDADSNGLSDTINRAVARAHEHADAEFPDDAETTLEVTVWDDGDFRVHIHHGIDNGHVEIHESKRINYRAEEGVFVFRHIEERIGWHNDRAIEERILEAYP